MHRFLPSNVIFNDLWKIIDLEQGFITLFQSFTISSGSGSLTISVYFCLLFRFSRGSVQTVLPLNRQHRPTRLCANYDDQISDLKIRASSAQKEAQQCRRRKREVEDKLRDLQGNLQSVKVIIICLLFYSFQIHILYYCPRMSARDSASSY